MFSLKLFGGLSIETPSGPLTGRATQRHRLALLALLACQRAQTREKLIACLWSDAHPDRGRRLLSDSVYRINKALSAEVIVATGDELRLDGAALPSDVADFEAALADGRMQAAAELYTGPFLDGFFLDGAPEFERWVDAERDRLGRACAGALEHLAEERERAGDALGATKWWYRLAAHDPLSPRIAMRLMEALDVAGERGRALQHAKVFDSLYRERLEAEPPGEVAALAERLRRSPEPAPPPAAPAGASPWSADSARLDSPDAATRPAPGLSADRAARPRRRIARTVVVAGLLLLLSTAGVLWRRGATSVGPGSVSIAVLPFADLSPEGDHAYFASGMTEEVIGGLTRTGGVRVVAPAPGTTSDGADVQEVGARLGVEHILQGSVSRWQDSVRVHARLVRVADRAYLWSERYTAGLGSVFSIQDSIARAIAATLPVRLAGGGGALVEPTTSDLEAYNLFLRGRYAWHRRTREGLLSAAEHFEQAVARAPEYARAYAGLADAYAVLGFYDYLPPGEAFPKAEAAALRALAVDPDMAQPHATLGYVHLYYHWRWPEAERAFLRAIELNPGYSTAHQWYANYLNAMGRFREAERAMLRAMELDPLSLIANAALGFVQLYSGDPAEAIAQLGRTKELDPTFALAWYWSGIALEEQGRWQEAIREHERALELSPGSAIIVAQLAHARVGAGDTVGARQLLDGLLSDRGDYIPSFEIAKVHLALGERDEALAWLERAYRQRSHSMALLAVDPQLRGLRRDPRLQDLLRRVGHPTE